jgi:3-oxoacyl-[acyl-carrier protein] reductase
MTFRRKTALITGSAKGLGKTAAFLLAKQGFNVVINYKQSKDEADALVKDIRKFNIESMAVAGDISIRTDIQRMLSEINSAIGDIDVLINNAGPFMRERKSFAEYSFEEMEYLIRGNLLGVMQLDACVLPAMRKKKWGRIIHFGFGKAMEARGWVHRAVYAAAKVGLVSFTKSLAEEEAQHGITVNMICPGDIRGVNKEKFIYEVQHLQDEETPIGRPGSGEDVARVIQFLCQPESDFITGNILEVSGGLDPIQTQVALNLRHKYEVKQKEE